MDSLTEGGIAMEYYVVIFYKDGHYDVLIGKAESHLDATRKGEEKVTKWPGYKLYSVIWVNKKAIERGDLVHLYSV